MLLNFKKTLNSNIEQNEKLKAKDTEIQKTTTQRNENLVLPKENVENADL